MGNLTFFLKLLKSNELGYRRGTPGGGGQFLLIPKSTISFFPTLSPHNLNDAVNLTINGVSLQYIYHNSKYATTDLSEDRDEYRLYLNTGLKSTLAPFVPDDLVLFISTGTPNNYDMIYISKTHAQYSILLSYLTSKPNQPAKILSISLLHSLGLFPSSIGTTPPAGRIPEFTEEQLAAAFSAPIKEGVVTRLTTTSSRISRDSTFSKVIRHLYNYKCAITGQNINYETHFNIEAAHIIPKEFGGGDHPSNGIALSRDLHWAFDQGFFTITPDFKVNVHPHFLGFDNQLKGLHNFEITLPIDIHAYPDTNALKWRKENIFGKFKV